MEWRRFVTYLWNDPRSLCTPESMIQMVCYFNPPQGETRSDAYINHCLRLCCNTQTRKLLLALALAARQLM